ARGREGVKLLLSLKDPPTAVFCSNDFLALGAMEGARETGIKLPEDLSIVGFDDMEIASFVTPGLTTIRQPAYDMGKFGAEVLLNLIGNKSGKPIHKILETRLIKRESTAVVRTMKKEFYKTKAMSVHGA
ncbi:MAG: substrate-binding domain-containing protein, partial [Desulfobacteraceae bacterium]|nr:substrate-binding domain-containing protein [Desulfobacteraceae bacterium]